jgi:hypothetical protein
LIYGPVPENRHIELWSPDGKSTLSPGLPALRSWCAEWGYWADHEHDAYRTGT